MAITNLGAFRYIGLDADIATLPLNIEAGAIFDAYDTNRKFVWNGIAWIEFTSAVSGDTVILNGQSTDTKPTVDVMFSTRFIENDTGRTYVWDGINWNYENIDDESANFNELQPRSSFIQLFGDTFATTSASELYTLENLDSSAGGVTLTNNGTVLFTQAEDLPLRGYLVPNFNGIDQWLSTPTNSNIEVGTNSFVASIQFKTSVKDVFQTLFYYGNNDGINWHVSIDSSNVIRAQTDDGVLANTFFDLIPNRWQDGKWHTATMVWDKIQTLDTLSLTVDGEKIGELGVDLGTLTNAIDGLRIGARLNVATTQRFFQGQLANFQLYIAAPAASPDYNLPSLLHAGIRESATLGTIVIPVPDDTLRINNKFIIPSVSGNYSSSVINTSEGYYEIIQIEKIGTEKISIDGNEIIDQSNLFLSEGSHIIKYENTLASSLQFACLELIKRNGKDEGVDECGSGILFSDEIEQRSNDGGWQKLVSTTRTYNQNIIPNNIANGNFWEGDLFLKKGLYKISLTYTSFANAGIVDISFGGTTWNLNMASGGAVVIVQDSVDMFIEGGKTPIRFEIVGGDASFDINWQSLRFELITGKSNGDTVDIWGADADGQVVQALNGLSLVIATPLRFNGQRQNSSTGDLLNDQWFYTRYFSGGTYRVKYVTESLGQSGIVSIAWDSPGGNNIFDNIDALGGGDNQVFYTTVTIPRGFHNISFTVTGSSGGNHVVNVQLLQFTKIGTIENAELDDNSDPVHGALVPLGKIQVAQNSATMQLDFGGVDMEKYESIKVYMSMQSVGTGDLQLAINGLISDYNIRAIRNNAGTIEAYEPVTANTWAIIDSIGSTSTLTAEFELTNTPNFGNAADNRCFNKYTLGLNLSDYITGHLQQNTEDGFEKLTQIIFSKSGGSYGLNSRVTVYGVLR